MATIVIDFTAGPPTFKEDLGMVPFHLGCNAFVVHPNCALCNES